MPTVVTSTIGSGAGRDYATIQAWWDDLPADLTAVDEQHIGECYTDSVFDELLSFSGVTTDATRNIILRPATGERHNGQANSGVRLNYSGARSAATNLISVGNAFVTIDGLEITFSGPQSGTGWTLRGINISAADVTIKRCIVHDLIKSGSTGAIIGINCVTTVTNLAIVSNLVYALESSSGATADGIFALLGSGGSCDVEGNTVDDVSDGSTGGRGIAVNVAAGATADIQNNVATQCPAACFAFPGGGTYTSNTNASDDATADDAAGSGHLTGITAADQFHDIGTHYLPLANADLIDAGTDLGAVAAATDLLGRDRDSEADTWDIGAWEFALDPSFVAFSDSLVQDLNITRAHEDVNLLVDQITYTITSDNPIATYTQEGTFWREDRYRRRRVARQPYWN